MKLIMEGWRKFTTEVLGQETMATTMKDLGKPDETDAQEWISQNSNLPEKDSPDAWLDKAWASLSKFADKLAYDNLGPEAQETPDGAPQAAGGFDPVATITTAILGSPSMLKSYQNYLGGEEDDGSLSGEAIAAAELAYSEALDRFEEKEGHL